MSPWKRKKEKVIKEDKGTFQEPYNYQVWEGFTFIQLKSTAICFLPELLQFNILSSENK